MSQDELPEPNALPVGLPAPVDDGGADHLVGAVLPPVVLETSTGAPVTLNKVSPGRWVLFIYPSSGDPDAAIPDGWDQIPGARGCSQEACSFRDNLAALRNHGVNEVLALSSDRAEYQNFLIERFHLSYPMISDPHLELAESMGLPTFTAAGSALYKRLTMVIDGDTVEHVFYPVFPPDTHADEVVDWVRRHSSG